LNVLTAAVAKSEDASRNRGPCRNTARNLFPLSQLHPQSVPPDRRKPMESPVIKHSVLISGHKTSITLEDEFWNSLQEIAGERHKTVSRLITSIDTRRRKEFANLSSATRMYILRHYRNQVKRRGGILPSTTRQSVRIRSRRAH